MDHSKEQKKIDINKNENLVYNKVGEEELHN